ncbi:MAG TPA: CoA pyrophosphatase [Gammaproteobacteria bacterium]|nr:CoA pyrophosphatase [Gammaproteobacteria bacterium]
MTCCYTRDFVRSRIRDNALTGDASGLNSEGLRPAAVLVPLIERSGGINVVLTRRTEHLRDHAGQISFPGGSIEEHDASPAAAALREAEEEIGVPPRAVDLVGELPTYATGTGFLVYPAIGFLDSAVVFRPDPEEVAEIFEVPLDFFLDPGNHRPHDIVHRGRRYRLCAMPYGDYYIWGATAGMLRQLYRLLTRDDAPLAGSTNG